MTDAELKKIHADNERMNKACTRWMQSAGDGHTRFLLEVRSDLAYNKIVGRPEIQAISVVPTAEDGEEDPINVLANILNHDPKLRHFLCTAVDWWREAQKPKK